MNRLVLVLTVAVLFCSVCRAQDVDLAGTWNVTSTMTYDRTCTRGAAPGEVHAYVWIVSQLPGDAITVSVEGETSFPKLSGRWESQQSTLIAFSSNSAAFGKESSWFKLAVNGRGELVGVRRLVQDRGGPNGTPCFADYQVLAKKQ